MNYAALFLFAILIFTPNLAQAEEPKILISEFQTGSEQLGEVPSGCSQQDYDQGKLEFVELYNPNSENLSLTELGWRLEFTTESGATTRHFATLTGEVAAKSYFLVAYKCYLTGLADQSFNGQKHVDIFPKTSGGYLKVVDAKGVTVDQVSWGKAKPTEGWWHEPKVIGHDFSINRNFTTGDFSAPHTPTTPRQAFVDPTLPNPEEPPIVEEPSEPPANSCSQLVISELLPNPTGDDAGKEFIELYNPTQDSISMQGCTLKLNNEPKQFALPNAVISPGQFIVFYDSETGLTLTNSTAKTVWLISSSSEQGVEYQAQLGSDEAWAFIDGLWQATKKPTPNFHNEKQEAAPTTTLVRIDQPACAPGKVRDIQTNRCRNVAQTNSLAPCGPNQERNPQTNRCRSVSSATTTNLKDCEDGEQRNPQTNRCKKVLGSSTSLPQVAEVSSAPANKTLFWLVAAIIICSLLYGLYEWRHGLLRLWQKIKAKIDKA